MELSLKEYKERFYNDLNEIHWRHWTALGVSSHVRPERHWIIDLEPLIISTLAIGLNDQRLFSASFEWLIKNTEWMNLSRFKRILRLFMEPFPGVKELLVTPEMFWQFVNRYNKNARNKIAFKGGEPGGVGDKRSKEYEDFFKTFRERGVVTKPKLRDPSLLQILLRGFFGVDAHVETLINLLVNDNGNSNLIAKQIFYNQKNVYGILERWTAAQVVTKISGNKAASYSLNRKKELLTALGLRGTPRYLNWTRTFLLLDRITMVLSTLPWSEDEYLLSSFFRDLSRDSKPISKVLNVKTPEPTSYPGKEYFVPFASMTLKILRELRKTG